MALHFPLPTGSPEWPLVNRLHMHWPDATIDCGRIRMGGYRSRLALVAFNCRLAGFAFRSVLDALRCERVDAIVVSSDAELLGAALACHLRRRRLPITLIGFIYTERASARLSQLRLRAIRRMLSLATCVICFSQLEQARYRALFALERTRFVGVPYGLHVNRPQPADPLGQPYILSAGRSGRDYALLARVAAQTGIHCRIVCDADAPLRGICFPANVAVLRNCHGDDFFNLLMGAEMVVIPLAADDISAGQMVLLQAMALGKATVITRTQTSQEYGQDGRNLFFVEPGSMPALAAAIDALHTNPPLRARVGRAARLHYLANHSITAFADNIAAAVAQHGRR